MVSWEHVVIWIVLYTVFATIYSKRKQIRKNVSITGPILTIRSQKGLDWVERNASKYKKYWIPWGNLGVISAIITAIIGIGFVATSVFAMMRQPQDVAIEGPTDMIVIPGVNRFLPLAAAPEIILGLLIGMVVHEGGHAIYCRTGDINIKSTGVILAALIPLGAFVEPDEDEQFEATTGDQLRMYAAGIMNNYAVFILSLLIFMSIVTFAIAPVSGVGLGLIHDDSPAQEMGIQDGDIITHIDGIEINNVDEYNDYMSSNPNVQNVTINGEVTHKIDKGAFINRAPADSGVNPRDTITSINENQVKNPHNFESHLRNTDDYTANVGTSNGNEKEIVIGAHTTAQSSTYITDGLNLSSGQSTYIFEVDGERVYNQDDLINQIQNRSDETISVTYGDKNNINETEITVEENEETGIIVSNNISGISTSMLGGSIFPADEYHSMLSFGDSITQTLQNVLSILILPIGSIVPGLEFNFPGFTPLIQSFFEVTVGGTFTSIILFFTASIMYWTAWINFNLALFNCLPTFALDGGYILKATMEGILENKISDESIGYIITGVKSIMLILLLLIVFYPLLI